MDNILCPKLMFFTTENSEVERQTKASDLANPFVKVVTIAPKINNTYFFSLVFSSHLYGNAVKDITRVMGQVYKNIMVSITRNYTTVVIREM